MLKQITLAASAAVLLTACAGMDGGSGGSMSSTSMSSGGSMSGSSAMASGSGMASSGAAMGAMDYMTAAGQSDAYEMQSSTVALAQSRNAQVRAFANRMIRDHGMTTSTLMAAARRSGMTPPPAPPPLRPDQQQMVAQLQSAGPAIDSAYVQQQVMAHQQALALHSNYAQSGSDPNLRAAATAAVPIVQGHLQMAQSMAAGMR